MLRRYREEHNPIDINCKRLMSGFGVKTYTNRDYGSLINFLERCNVPFHLVEARNERIIKAVVKGLHPRTNPNTVTEELTRLGFPVRNTVAMYDNYRKAPNGMFQIHLTDNEKARSILDLTTLLFTTVRVEKYFQRPTPPQCTHCWRFGHTARQCKAPARCRKCAGQHVTSACTMPAHYTRLCVNCQGQHPATYRGCREYISYKTLHQRRLGITSQTAGAARLPPPPPAPSNSLDNFPILLPSQVAEPEPVPSRQDSAAPSEGAWQVAGNKGKKGKQAAAHVATSKVPLPAKETAAKEKSADEEVFILTSQPGTSTDYRRPNESRRTFSQVASAPPAPRPNLPQTNREWANAFKRQAATWDPQFTLSLMFQILNQMSACLGENPFLFQAAQTIGRAMAAPTRPRRPTSGRRNARKSPW